MRMKRYQILPMTLIGAIAALGGTAIGYALGSETELHSTDIPAYNIASVSTTPPALWDGRPTSLIEAPRYMLGIEHGFITVFYANDGNPTLKERTRTPETALSLEEHERLLNGVYFYTEEQLVRALQDYSS